MRKIIFTLLISTFVVAGSSAQEKTFNRWSIEAAGGLHKPSRPFVDGYFAPNFGAWQGSLGVRYMMNEKFGLKLDFGYNDIQEDDNSLPFESQYYRTNLQGVVNLGNLFAFNDWTNTIGLLLHGGAGLGILQTDKKAVISDETDYMANFIVGITPQFRLSKSLAFTTDLTIIGNVNQDFTWDGNAYTVKRGFDGMLVNVSAGLTLYLGDKDVHADWYSEEAEIYSQLDSIENRLSKIETDLMDTDQDGVPDYLDREPNTISGVAVDSKGRAIDLNNNGIPDEMEPALDARYAKKGEGAQGGNASMTIKELIDNGYVNVYFRFNSDQPETYSLQAVNYLIVYMKENSSAKATLIGYADEIGNPAYNQQLSERRANKVKDLLVAAGIDGNRLTVKGGGEDTTVNKNSTGARQLVRRVTFKLN
ncbi:MAG: cell envelope biogenesis protein OmpA [Bacteroidetes bacterium HGW-Bacteroidetes-2]|nr:MAG: cell envelope biogenesis protein OmpA [Bacteroidetes bacterium HGW-Bacteroidetes-2]